MDQKRADKRTIPELFQHFWSQALVAVTGAEEDAVKLLGKVQEAAGWSQDEVRRQAREFSERLTGQRKELEARVEATVQASLGRLHVPRREEIEQLSAKVESLTKRLETLEK